MTLLQAEMGKSYYIENIELENSVTRRLQMLGMTKGTIVSLLNKKKKGAVIVRVRGTRFALGRNFAEGILIGGEIDGK